MLLNELFNSNSILIESLDPVYDLKKKMTEFIMVKLEPMFSRIQDVSKGTVDFKPFEDWILQNCMGNKAVNNGSSTSNTPFGFDIRLGNIKFGLLKEFRKQFDWNNPKVKELKNVYLSSAWLARKQPASMINYQRTRVIEKAYGNDEYFDFNRPQEIITDRFVDEFISFVKSLGYNAKVAQRSAGTFKISGGDIADFDLIDMEDYAEQNKWAVYRAKNKLSMGDFLVRIIGLIEAGKLDAESIDSFKKYVRTIK